MSTHSQFESPQVDDVEVEQHGHSPQRKPFIPGGLHTVLGHLPKPTSPGLALHALPRSWAGVPAPALGLAMGLVLVLMLAGI